MGGILCTKTRRKAKYIMLCGFLEILRCFVSEHGFKPRLSRKEHKETLAKAAKENLHNPAEM